MWVFALYKLTIKIFLVGTYEVKSSTTVLMRRDKLGFEGKFHKAFQFGWVIKAFRDAPGLVKNERKRTVNVSRVLLFKTGVIT